MLFAVIMIVMILVLPASILHAIEQAIMKMGLALENAVSSKLAAASAYNSP